MGGGLRGLLQVELLELSIASTALTIGLEAGTQKHVFVLFLLTTLPVELQELRNIYVSRN